MAAPCPKLGFVRQVCTVSEITGFRGETKDVGAAPNPGGFLIAPGGVLTIIHIGKRDAGHKIPLGQKPMPRVFEPPPGWGQVSNYFQCPLDQPVGGRQVPRPRCEGTAVLGAGDCGHDYSKLAGLESFFVVPGQHIYQDVRPPPRIDVHGGNPVPQFSVNSPYRAGATE